MIGALDIDVSDDAIKAHLTSEQMAFAVLDHIELNYGARIIDREQITYEYLIHNDGSVDVTFTKAE